MTFRNTADYDEGHVDGYRKGYLRGRENMKSEMQGPLVDPVAEATATSCKPARRVVRGRMTEFPVCGVCVPSHRVFMPIDRNGTK